MPGIMQPGIMQPVIMHVDMDAFYASVEMIDRPKLKKVPMYVGGAGRGVVLSANYPARKFGVRAGMSTVKAHRLCPEAVVIRPDFDHYAQVSAGVFEILRTVTDKVEKASIDEAYLDLSGTEKRLGSPSAIGQKIRELVAVEQRITCSVGIGENKFIAKMASQQAKPDGLLEVEPESVIDFLHPLPVTEMWSVGDVTATKLHKLGLRKIADLAHTPKRTLQRAFGDRIGERLFDLSWGRAEATVHVTEPEKSIGAQKTFESDTSDERVITTELLRLSLRVAARARAAEVCGRQVSISVRFSDFTTINKTGALNGPTDITDEIFAQAKRLYYSLHLQTARVRRVGVRLEKLVAVANAYQQPSLDEADTGMRQAELAADSAIRKFGPNAVKRARLLDQSN